jgi:cytochrome c553
MGGVWLGLAGAALGSILVDGDAGAGQQKAAVCAACHGPDGNSTNPQWPKIAGQNAAYLLKQLHNFKNPDTGRNNPIMTAQVAALSDQDMADLAEYFAAQPPSPGVADPQLVETGQALYRGGDLERGIVACSGCHGPQGRGNAAAKIPALAGQHAEYTAAQLKAFRAMERANDPNQMMRDAAMRLTDQDIAAVASYLQGLR